MSGLKEVKQALFPTSIGEASIPNNDLPCVRNFTDSLVLKIVFRAPKLILNQWYHFQHDQIQFV